jgi:peroxiredoxin
MSSPRPAAGDHVPDFELPDHNGNRRRLSELVRGDPTILQFYRGFWCPMDQAQFWGLVQLQDHVEVAYTRMISVSVEPPEVEADFRAGIGGRWTFLADESRELQAQLGCSRPPTPSIVPTSQACSPSFPICESAPPTTATGFEAVPPTPSWPLISEPSRRQSGPIGRRPLGEGAAMVTRPWHWFAASSSAPARPGHGTTSDREFAARQPAT